MWIYDSFVRKAVVKSQKQSFERRSILAEMVGIFRSDS